VNVLVLEPYRYDTAPCQRFRIEQWARVLERQRVAFTFVPFVTRRLEAVMYRPGFVGRKLVEVVRGAAARLRLLGDLSRFDSVFLVREAAPVGPPVVERLLARRGLPTVYDFDDAVYLPNASGANRMFAPLKWTTKVRAICGLADHVTVGNEHLRQFAEPHARAVSVLPTTIDVERCLPRPPHRSRDPVVIGWMGSETTVPHLLTIAGALRRLASRRRFVLHVVSTREVSIPGVEVRSTRWTSDGEIRDVQSFDIGIMPLPDDAWTRAKCGTKLLLCMGAGVAGVASPVGVSAAIVDDGVNGFLAKDDDEWVDRLSALIDSAALRTSLGAAARRTVEARYSAQVVAPALLDVLRRCRRA
jgi:glycosyltransferase involved in cell wall biosynthesis